MLLYLHILYSIIKCNRYFVVANTVSAYSSNCCEPATAAATDAFCSNFQGKLAKSHRTYFALEFLMPPLRCAVLCQTFFMCAFLRPRRMSNIFARE